MRLKSTSLLLAAIALCLSSCVKEPSSKDPGKEGEEENTESVSDLKITSFKVLPETNRHIYGDVVCSSEDGTTWTAEIQNYKTDLSALIATFETNAAKVTVGSAEQKSGETPNDFSNEVVYRLYTTKGEYKEFKVRITNPESGYTGFPVVAIVTKDRAPITSKEKWIEGTVTIDKQNGDCEEYSGTMEIKGRGHNSWSQTKKPYNIKLSSKASIMGMPSHKRWVLLANALDRTLMRNRVAYEIARRTGLAWTPRNEYIDVLLNGKFLGSYLICEHIRVDKNRVNIPELSADITSGNDLTGGYLLEIDRYYDEVNKFRSQYRDLPVNISNPDEDVLNEAQRKYITDYFNNVERLLYAGNEIDPSYSDYIDIDSFIDWWVVTELTHNRDTRLPGSCWMYKDRMGKLYAGPIWDFDLTTFIPSQDFILKNYETDNSDPVEKDRSLWYKKLFTDPVFNARVKERWASYKTALEGIPEFIDTEASKIQVSAKSNWKIWTISGSNNRDESLPWGDAVSKLKQTYIDRLNWLDSEIQKF